MSPKVYMDTSDDRAAYLPSKPSIPIPILDSNIIPTSLPPSPILQTILFEFLIIFVIYAFCFGSHLQTITEVL